MHNTFPADIYRTSYKCATRCLCMLRWPAMLTALSQHMTEFAYLLTLVSPGELLTGIWAKFCHLDGVTSLLSNDNIAAISIKKACSLRFALSMPAAMRTAFGLRPYCENAAVRRDMSACLCTPSSDSVSESSSWSLSLKGMVSPAKIWTMGPCTWIPIKLMLHTELLQLLKADW